MPIKILIVDDHSVVRQGLRMFLTLDPDLDVIGEANNGAAAIAAARELSPDVVLMDILMPVMDGIAATAALRKEMPDIEVIALTSVLDDGAVTRAIRAGAIGYILKDTEADELCRAIKAAAAGQVQLSPRAAQHMMAEMRKPEPATAPADELTERELAVLRLLAAGRSNKEIARELIIAEKTVKTHVSAILAKFGMQSRTQAALYAVRCGLVAASEKN